MKMFLAALLVGSMMATAIPVIVQAHDENGAAADDNWDNGGATYSQFDQEYQHIWQGIQHGVSDGSYTQRQAYRFYRQMRYIHARADGEQRSGNYDPEPIQAQLESLHERLHIAHAQGHQRLDSYGYNRGNGYNNGYDRNNGYNPNNGYNSNNGNYRNSGYNNDQPQYPR